jgi:hypothetical protein
MECGREERMEVGVNLSEWPGARRGVRLGLAEEHFLAEATPE